MDDMLVHSTAGSPLLCDSFVNISDELYLHSIHLISAIGEEHLVGVGGGVVLPGAAHRPGQYDQDCLPPGSLLTLSRVSSQRRVST